MKAVDLTDWKMNADLFNKFGKQVKDAGMTFGYHNHSAEFKKYDGQTAFDYLYANTDPALVKIELDVGWVQVAQHDPIAILNKYKGRVIALHVKDVGARGADGKDPTSVAVGEGVIDWKKVIGTANANGVKHYFYEQEEPFTRPILDSAKISGGLPDQARTLTTVNVSGRREDDQGTCGIPGAVRGRWPASAESQRHGQMGQGVRLHRRAAPELGRPRHGPEEGRREQDLLR